jgi:hypothetical protein
LLLGGKYERGRLKGRGGCERKRKKREDIRKVETITSRKHAK